jgi:ribosomal protein L21E
MEEHVKLAMKMKECRVAARKLYGKKFRREVKPYITIIEKVQKGNGIEVMPALHKITQEEEYWPKLGTVGQMMMLAAAVEMIDPG